MILDSCKLFNAIFQIEYADAFEIWDSAGTISRKLSDVWPGLESYDAQPNQQILVAPNIRIETGITKSTISLDGNRTLTHPKAIEQIKNTFDIWRKVLSLNELKRVSTRAQYAELFPSMQEANSKLFSFGLVTWPETQVFNQSTDSEKNTFDVRYRFHDEESFAHLQIRTEKLIYEAKLNPNYIENNEIKKTINQLVIDFDRGITGTINSNQFNVEDWIKGFVHILRRDINKIIKE